MVKTVSELESRVKNYHGKTKKQKDGSACMHASGWREMEVGGDMWLAGWLEGDGGGHLAGWTGDTWLAGWLVPRLPIYIYTHGEPAIE
jgi:hypothetical protein